jgi:hypothetical protein
MMRHTYLNICVVVCKGTNTCDIEVRGQAFLRGRETRGAEERVHLEGIWHDDAKERPVPVHAPDGVRHALGDGIGNHHDEEKSCLQPGAEEWIVG